MAKIDDYIIRQVLEAARIEEVVADFVELTKKGVRYLGLCPFHDDKSLGSFVVYPKGNCYKCFACDAKGGVVDFLMEHEKLTYPDAIRWLGKKYHIEVDDVPLDYTPPPPRPKPAPLPTLELPMTMVYARYNTNNNLCNWMRSLPWDAAQQKRLDEVLANYYVGTSKQGHAIFWQIDEEDKVRTGKMMKYREDGHRDKESLYNFGWIHRALFNDARHPQYDENKQEMRQTLFGMHLLKRYPHAAVHIVESEKTAIIMATAYGNHLHQVWMACGGVENLSTEKLKPIINEHRRIVLYPDRDGIDRWRAKQENLRYDRMSLNVEAITKWWKPKDGDKADIADVVVRMICEHSMPPKPTLKQLADENPAIQTMIDKLKLEEDKTENEQKK